MAHIISGAHIDGDHRYMGWTRLERMHVRGKHQWIGLSAPCKDIFSSDFDVIVFPALIHNTKMYEWTWLCQTQQECDTVVRTIPSKQCLATLKTHAISYTQQQITPFWNRRDTLQRRKRDLHYSKHGSLHESRTACSLWSRCPASSEDVADTDENNRESCFICRGKCLFRLQMVSQYLCYYVCVCVCVCESVCGTHCFPL